MFVKFFARGVIYERDKDNRICGVKTRRSGSGVIKDTPALMGGGVFRQCPQLLPCDDVTVRTYPL